jgi:hypothetical protein
LFMKHSFEVLFSNSCEPLGEAYAWD